MAVQASLLACSTARLNDEYGVFTVKSGLLLSATASLMLLGSTAVFAQSYAAPGAVTMKPGQIQSADPSSPQPGVGNGSGVGIVTLKPGETVGTALPQDFGSVQAGATNTNESDFAPLKPGQPG